MRKILLLVSILLSCCVSAHAAVTTIYATEDTRLNPSAATTNYGTNPLCVGTGENSACTFKFDLTGVNASDIISVDFKIFGESRGFQHTMVVSRLLRDWNQNQATWNVATTGNNWGTAGALNSTSDFTTTNQATGAVPDNAYLTFDVTNMVKDQINLGNFGFLMRGSANQMYTSWRTSEYATQAYRPSLVIRTGTPGTPTHYYLRNDGGTCGLTSPQCDGTHDAPLLAAVDGPDPGSEPDCACSHPKYLTGDDAGTPQFMLGEDIVHIRAGDAFTISSPLSYVPGGSTASNLTKILGDGWDTGCANPPKFVGDGVVNVYRDSSNTDTQCLIITDSNGCISQIAAGGNIDNNASQDPIRCALGNATPGSAFIGIKLATGATNVGLKNVTVNGPSYKGLEGFQIGKIDFDNFHINGAGFVGMDGDPGGCHADDITDQCDWIGPVTFKNSSVKWSGCGWRAKDTPGGALAGTAHDCWSQDQGGYGDAFGINGFAGAWAIESSEMSFNVSDGWDFLYSPAAPTTVSRARCEGNAGACFKSGNPNVIINNGMMLGDCTNWKNSPYVYGNPAAPGRAGTACNNNGTCDANENFNSCGDCVAFNVCRPANHSTLSLTCGDGIAPQIYNTTVGGNSDAIIFLDTRAGCSSSVIMNIKNVNVYGATEYNGGELDIADYFYGEGVAPLPTIVGANNVICGTKTWSTDCIGETNSTCLATCDNVFVGPLDDFGPTYYTGTNYFDAHYLKAGSPAINRADEGVPMINSSNDVNNFSRGSNWDSGGLQFGSTANNALSPDVATCLSNGACSGGFCCYGSCSSTACNTIPLTNKNKLKLRGTFGR